jgi:MFS family permease
MTINYRNGSAILFILLLGVVSLFADITYEGARSISGQYLAILGASGTIVGIVAGFGEFVGYGLRLVSGYVTDRTGSYWLMTFVGYALNLFAVPLLALADNWPLASALLIVERLGKAIRTPARDAMLSYATQETGRGWGFGIHKALDQVGAVIGPLIVSAILYFRGSYQASFASLLIPTLCALTVLAVARALYPRPQELEIELPQMKAKGLSRKYWLYISAVSCIAAGYVDFSLIAFHLKKTATLPEVWMPSFYAIAMATSGVSALVFGRLYDIRGFSTIIFVTLLSSLFVVFVFRDAFYAVLIGLMLWGLGIGAQESIMRAVVANLVPMHKRGIAYGLLNVGFGIFWFLGSALMGFLYDTSLVLLIVFSLSIQLASIPLLVAVKKLT